MKKTAMRVSGNITLVMFFLLFLISLLAVCTVVGVTAVSDVVASSQILKAIASIITITFVTIPAYLLSLTGLSIPAEISTTLSIAFAVFSFLMFLWGIKEVKIANKDNQNFAKCKKTCGFMMFTKFMFFAYLVAVVVLSVIDEVVSNVALLISDLLSVSNIYLIITAVLAILAFVIFVLPVANISVVYNAVKYGEDYEEPVAQNTVDAQNADNQELQSFYTQAPQPTMQANMPPMPGYKPQVVVQTTAQPQMQAAQQPTNMQQNNGVVQPNIQPQVATQPQATVQQPAVQPQVSAAPVQPTMQQNVNVQPQMQQNIQPQTSVQPQTVAQSQMQTQPAAQAPAGQGGIVPGQDGVPANISEKGIADLQRLERLKSMGAITPENYAAMKQKICSTNLQ